MELLLVKHLNQVNADDAITLHDTDAHIASARAFCKPVSIELQSTIASRVRYLPILMGKFHKALVCENAEQ